MTEFVLGIDGGGTSCRAAVADRSGMILGRGKSGSANILTNPDLALKHIADAAIEAVAAAGLDIGLDHMPALLGLAGNNAGDAVNHVLARLPFSAAAIESDGLIALEGAVGHGDGSIAILGTGSIFYLRHAGIVHHIGGWGFIIGDFGSGAKIGQAALAESLIAHDGIGPASGMTARLLAGFGNEPGPMVDFARHASPGDFARFAPDVFADADHGDPVARDIIRKAALSVDAALDRMVQLSGAEDRLCLLGGLATLYEPWLSPRHRRRLAPPKGDALSGAVQLACRRFAQGGPA